MCINKVYNSVYKPPSIAWILIRTLLYAAEKYEPTMADFEPLTSHKIINIYPRM
jgi:hypothetical protein